MNAIFAHEMLFLERAIFGRLRFKAEVEEIRFDF